MWREFLSDFLPQGKYRAIGAIIGCIFGLMAITIGLIKTFFVLICTLLGFYIGKGMDLSGGFSALLNKLFGNNNYR